MATRQKVSPGISDNGDGTASITVGLFGQSVPISSLFDRSQDLDSVKMNLIANWQLGAYGSPDANEFLVGVNGSGANGLEGPDGKYKILSIDANGPDRWSVLFKVAHVGTTYGFDITAAQLNDPDGYDPVARVISNLRAFTRIAGLTSLNAAAIAQIQSAKFVV